MSHSHHTTTPSSSYQFTFDNGLKTYQKHTKVDLLTHPFLHQLQACESPAAILAILQQQVQGLGQSLSGDDRWIKWLDPTVRVLHAFSGNIGGVGMVCLRT